MSLVIVMSLCFVIAGCSKEAKMERHWKKGEQYFQENKMREAVLEYRNVIKLEPKHAKAHYKLGLTYLRMRMIREAYAAINKAVEIDPEMIDARNQLGAIYLLARDAKKAREQADYVLQKDPNNSSAHLLLSRYLWRRKIWIRLSRKAKRLLTDNKIGGLSTPGQPSYHEKRFAPSGRDAQSGG